MKNKKGFVFVETIVVVSVLTISLLMVYSAYSSMLIKEKSRLKYNDSAYLYRTYYVTKFFKNFRFDFLIDNFDESENLLFLSFGCATASFIEGENKGFCEIITNDLHINRMYLARADLSALQDCTDNSGVCKALDSVGNRTATEYIKTIGGKGSSGYRIIFEFSENKDGTLCTGEGCQFYYTTLSLGELQ